MIEQENKFKIKWSIVNESGMMLVELVASLSIFGIVMAVLTTTYIQVEKGMRDSKEKTYLIDTASSILKNMSENFRNIDNIQEISPSRISVILKNGDTITYIVDKPKLFKNGESILPFDVNLDSLEITYLNNLIKILIQLSRRDTILIKTAVLIR